MYSVFKKPWTNRGQICRTKPKYIIASLTVFNHWFNIYTEPEMIQTFKGKESELIYHGYAPKGFPPDIARRALHKLIAINEAETLADLRIPPSNRLEQLKGDRKGQFSIRINDQFRICFSWKDGNAYDVEIVDYH